MKISEFHIDRYGPLGLPNNECDGGLEVIYGPNESGKTLLLEALLKLLDPDISSVMPAVERVSESPRGYVAIETADDEWVLGDDHVLSDVAPIDAMHLRNIFVIRDNDLRLEDQHQFYDSVTEQIGDLHTSEIETIQSRFEDLGRLTPTTRKISSATQYNDAGNVRDTAETLAEEIRGYVEEAQADDLDELESELIRVQTEIRGVRRELDAQEAAKTAADHERLSERLSTVEETTEEINELAEFSRETLEELNGLDQEIGGDEDRIRELEGQIDDLEGEIQELQERAGNLDDELQPLEDREEEIDEVDEELEAFRTTEDSSAGADRSMRLARVIAALGIGLGGLATLWGVIQGQSQLLPALLFLGVGLAGAVWYYLKHRSLTAVERERESLLRKARDAGLAVESVSDIAPAIEEFRDELATKQDRKDRLEREIDVKDGLIDEHRGELDDLRPELERKREEKEGILQEAGVSDIDEYRRNVERKEDLRGDRSPAEQSLIDRFGEPDEDDWDSKIAFWREELQEFAQDVDLDEVDPADHDEETHANLNDKRRELEDKQERLQVELESHRNAIEDYGRRAWEINARTFIDEEISLRADTIDGLIQLAQDLDRLVFRIKRDAEISREALKIFDELHDEEEEKITTLFEPDGRASQVFQEITDGRYQRVEYDPDERTLKVHRDTDQIRTTDELSRGTREQLYLAARISLADQLLEAEPGFFLMDDAFLPADRTRLTEGFQILQDLVDQGWQVIYLTAKEEVGVEMVEEFDLDCRTLNTLP